MSDKKQGKVIHVENVTIHAKNVEFTHEHRRREEDRRPDERRNPWGWFWGRQRNLEDETKNLESSEHRKDHE